MKFVRWISNLWGLGFHFRIAVGVGLGLLVITFLYPFQSTTVPQWNLRVVDDAGTPVRGINVTEHWQHHPVESSEHEEVQRTNQDGFVSFDIRTFRASLARRLFARLNAARQRPRSRTEPYGAIVAWGSKAHATTVAVYQENEMPAPEVRVQRLR